MGPWVERRLGRTTSTAYAAPHGLTSLRPLLPLSELWRHRMAAGIWPAGLDAALWRLCGSGAAQLHLQPACLILQWCVTAGMYDTSQWGEPQSFRCCSDRHHRFCMCFRMMTTRVNMYPQHVHSACTTSCVAATLLLIWTRQSFCEIAE